MNQKVFNQNISIINLWSHKGSVHMLPEKVYIFQNLLLSRSPVRSSVPGRKERTHVPHDSHETSWVQLQAPQKGSMAGPLTGSRVEERTAGVPLQSVLMKTGPLERFPLQLSDIPTNMNSKSTWVSLFHTLCLFSLFIFIYSVHPPDMLGEPLSYGRGPGFLCAGSVRALYSSVRYL